MTETNPVYAEPDGTHVETCECDGCMVEHLTSEVDLLRRTVREREATIRQLRAQLRNALKA